MLSTDLGQVFNPPVEDGLALFADRFLAAGFTDEEVQHDGRCKHPQTCRRGAVSRRIQVIGRTRLTSCGAPAARSPRPSSWAARLRSLRCPTASAASQASCGRRRARRSRTSRRSATPRPKPRPPSSAQLPCARPRRLPAADRHRRAQPDRRDDPRVRARRAGHPHRHRPVQPRPPVAIRRRPRAQPRRRRGRAERLQDDQAAGAVPVRAAPARAVQLHADHLRRHHLGLREEAGGDGTT